MKKKKISKKELDRRKRQRDINNYMYFGLNENNSNILIKSQSMYNHKFISKRKKSEKAI